MSIERLTAALSDRYRVDRVLGVGGMATVYLAEDLKHHRPVAIKVMLPELAATLGADRFLREVEIAARLSHPNILPVYDSGQADGMLYYVMPLVEGESLTDRLAREKQLPVGDALRLAREVADALAYAHAHGIVHRDIKPANILINAGHAIVADFGIARATSALTSGAQALTQTGFAVGTPQYMSPEQSSGDANVDGRTDIYALGCVLYEMLAGEAPFNGPTPQAIIARSIADTARPLQQTRPSIAPAISNVVATAMAKTPADRYATASDFASALVVAEDQSRTGAISGATVIAPVRKKSWLWPAVGAAAVVALIAGGVKFMPRTVAASTARSVAVLPFENKGPEEQAYFADGIVDDLRDRLARLDQLTVIASASADQYRQSTKSGIDIAKELRVDQLLMGKVTWGRGAGDVRQVRVVTELVNGETGAVSWRESFDADSADAFSIQGRIATAVAGALGTGVANSAAKDLGGRPTKNDAAYEAFLKGRALHGNEASVARARAAFYEQAVALDSNFARAWGALAGSLCELYSNGTRDKVVGERARFAVDQVLRLANDSAGAHAVAADYHRMVTNDVAAMRKALDRAFALDSNHSATLSLMARSDIAAGSYERGVARLARARAIDPRNRGLLVTLLEAQTAFGRHDDAQRSADELMTLKPSLAGGQLVVRTALARGDTARMRTNVATLLGYIPAPVLVAYFAGYQEMAFVLAPAERALLFRLTPAAFDNDRAWWAQSLATAYRQQGDFAKSRAYGDSALVLSKRQSDDAPTDPQLRVIYGVMLAYAGHSAEATQEVERALREMGPTNTMDGFAPYIQLQAVRVFLANLQYDKAMDELDRIMASRFYVTPAWLRADPTFAPLRGNPRFERMLQAPRV